MRTVQSPCGFSSFFRSWREVWATFDKQQRRMVGLAWKAARPVIAKARPRWTTVNGTMTAVIATALDTIWAPASPSKWLNVERDAYAGIEADHADWDLIDEAIHSAVIAQQWGHAAKRSDDSGLE